MIVYRFLKYTSSLNKNPNNSIIIPKEPFVLAYKTKLEFVKVEVKDEEIKIHKDINIMEFIQENE